MLPNYWIKVAASQIIPNAICCSWKNILRKGGHKKINGPLRGLVGGKQGKDLKSYEKNTLFLRITQTDRNTLKGLFALTKLWLHYLHTYIYKTNVTWWRKKTLNFQKFSAVSNFFVVVVPRRKVNLQHENLKNDICK